MPPRPIDRRGLAGHHPKMIEGAACAKVNIARINEHAFEYLCAPIRRITCPDLPFPYFQVEKHFLPDADDVIAAVQETVAWE